MPTRTVEDYVKQLYLAEQGLLQSPKRSKSKAQLVMLSQLATAMDVTPGTVTTMMRTLSEAGLVRYEPRFGCALTEPGKTLALHVLRRHRLVELFLTQTLGFDWSEVHEEAEVLEHSISERLLDRIDEHLGRPEFDPHGDPIPDREGKVPARADRSLADVSTGDRVKVVRIEHQDAAFLTYAKEQGLVPGKMLTIQDKDAVAQVLRVQSGGRSIALSLIAAMRVRVVSG
jgi:DtxR family transcriptional regulator, Mn-dependent transcriptional regulator